MASYSNSRKPDKKPVKITTATSTNKALVLLFQEVYRLSSDVEDVKDRLTELLEINKKILKQMKSFHEFEKKMFNS